MFGNSLEQFPLSWQKLYQRVKKPLINDFLALFNIIIPITIKQHFPGWKQFVLAEYVNFRNLSVPSWQRNHTRKGIGGSATTKFQRQRLKVKPSNTPHHRTAVFKDTGSNIRWNCILLVSVERQIDAFRKWKETVLEEVRTEN